MYVRAARNILLCVAHLCLVLRGWLVNMVVVTLFTIAISFKNHFLVGTADGRQSRSNVPTCERDALRTYTPQSRGRFRLPTGRYAVVSDLVNFSAFNNYVNMYAPTRKNVVEKESSRNFMDHQSVIIAFSILCKI